MKLYKVCVCDHLWKMITDEFAMRFVKEWIEAWNSHDINKIMHHYVDGIDFTSPFIIALNNDPNGRIINKISLEDYFRKALDKFPNLHFELLNIYSCVDSIIIQYKSVQNKTACEYIELNDNGKIIKVKAHYLIGH